MSNIWLYPVSERSGFSFPGQPDTSLRSFRNMIRSGGTDSRWHVTDHRDEIQRGDVFAIYEAKTRRDPPYLIGTGVVVKAAEWYERWQTYVVGLQLDREECRRLSELPIPATYLMGHLPRQKRAVVELPPRLQSWVKRRLAARRAIELAAYSELAALRTEAKTIRVGGRTYEAVLRHDPLIIVPLRRRLEHAGWDVIPGDAEGGKPDLIASNRRGDRLLLVEGKTVGSKGGRIEIRYAIGQLLDYAFFLLPDMNLGNTKCDRLILLERKPDSKFIGFVESLDIGLAWMAGNGIAGGPLAKRMLRGL